MGENKNKPETAPAVAAEPALGEITAAAPTFVGGSKIIRFTVLCTLEQAARLIDGAKTTQAARDVIEAEVAELAEHARQAEEHRVEQARRQRSKG